MEKANNNNNHYPKVLMIVLGAILLLLVFLFVREYRHLRRIQVFNYHRSLLASIGNRAPLGVNDVDLIETWMTFSYLNKVFNLPADYLKTNLKISDSRYPRVLLGSYAKHSKLEINGFMNDVKNAIRGYLTSKQ